MVFFDVKTPQVLKELNNFLADNSYINGYTPNKADIYVFDALDKTPAGDYPNVQRWFRHIASFEASEKSAWGGFAWPQCAGAKPTVGAAANVVCKQRLATKESKTYCDACKQRLAAEKFMPKSSVLLDVLPRKTDTNMEEMENNVRTIAMDGLLWGDSELIPVGYGIEKLQIVCFIEDYKVPIGLLADKIKNFKDFVKSVDIAAINKIYGIYL